MINTILTRKILGFKFDRTNRSDLTLYTSVSTYKRHLWGDFGIKRNGRYIHICKDDFRLDKLVRKDFPNLEVTIKKTQ